VHLPRGFERGYDLRSVDVAIPRGTLVVFTGQPGPPTIDAR
jgi:hypothetical protein